MTDFSWQGVNAAHAILSCEMERGSLQWEDTDRLDRIRRAHAQKHIPSSKSTWGRSDKKPWFCKSFQTNLCVHKDYEVNGRLNRHICAFCLTLDSQTILRHPLGWSSCESAKSVLIKTKVNVYLML